MKRQARTLSAATAGLLLAGAAAALPARAAGTVYYVGPTGCTTTGPGTDPAQPWCTISAAAAVAMPGDTVQVAAGTYAEQVTPPRSGTSGSPIVFTAPNGGAVVTGGPKSHAFSISSRGYITVSGFTVSGTSSSGIYVTSSNNIVVSGNTVSGAGQPVSGYTAYGIYLSGDTDSTVAGNVSHDNSAAGIILTGGTTRVTVDGNESYNNANGYQRAATGIDLRSAGNVVIHNRVHDNEDSGIQAYPGGNNNVIAANVSYHNKGFTTTAETNCDWTVNHNGCITGDHGIDDYGTLGNRLVGNSIYDNVSAGINVEGVPHSTLAAAMGATDGTLSVTTASGFPASGSYDIVIGSERMTVTAGAGSTTWTVTRGVFGTTAAAHASGSVVLQPGGFLVENNISVDNAVNCSNGSGGTTTCNRTKGEIRVDQYSWVDTSADYDIVSTSVAGSYVYTWQNPMYKTLGDLQDATGEELNGRQSDPGWIAPGSGDFRLGAGSPAIDYADSGASGEQSTDAAGNPRVDDPATPNCGVGPRTYDERGAYEYQPPAGATSTSGQCPAPGDRAPKASLVVRPSSADAPVTVTADASASTDTDSTGIASYQVDFGDGTTVGPQAGATATHAYAAAGTYPVRLTVTDTAGLTSTASGQVTVAATGTNRVGNPGFETGTTGWGGSGSGMSVSQVTGGSSGAFAGAVTNTTAGNLSTCGLTDAPNWVAMTQSGTYTASLWVRADSPVGKVTLQVREYDGSTFVGSASAAVTLTTSWQQVTTTYTVQHPGTSTLDFTANASNGSAGIAPGVCFDADDASEVPSGS